MGLEYRRKRRAARRKRRKRYRTLFFFDRTVPRDLYFSVQRRLNYLGYGAVWQPRSSVRGRNREFKEILDYCMARGIRILVTFSKKVTNTDESKDIIKIVRLKGGKKRTVNKILSIIFTELRSGEKN